MKVFLGGTCNNSKWREVIIDLLDIDYFNPVVDDWTEDCMQEEIEQRQKCDFCLYTITPKMTGVYSIAELIDDVNKRPEQTIFCLLESDDEQLFDEGQLRSLHQVGQMVLKNGGKYFVELSTLATFLNGQKV